jgi:hypothetical protein
MNRLVLVILVALGCDDKKAATNASTTVAAPKPTAAAAKEYELSSRDSAVKLKFTPPVGWSEWKPSTDFVTFQGGGFGADRGKITIGLTCHGGCDEKDFPKNIVKQRKEEFDFVTKPNHIPQLKPEWLTETKEEKPGLWFSRWDAKDDKGAVAETHVVVDRTIAGVKRIVYCEGQGKNVAELEKICRDLDITPIAQAAPAK